ncbi:uncharacterized protein LOC123865959 [Maniola jurtina]|uniref:uncharacterized protein LOC123865959 n=1 Tax=Maniola jurtina TaxID=191418 RepID=UPI001E68C434|nr:uncharacterized protein LOC123865959 [Maniola jurtina]XP_045763162.1 uncharacterized protein LOC123865959 [Maniola jurtina]
MAPTTRRAAVMEEQEKLRTALRELKSLKQLNEQLLKEQEDSEVELRAIIAKNTQLKAELADLNKVHTLVLEERDQLQDAVGSFNQCIQTYDEALSKISMLENELSRAQKTIDDLQSQLQSYEAKDTNNLYDELLTSSSIAPVVTIDLTCDSPCASDTNPLREDNLVNLNSHNKIKKYIKLNKIIRKTQRLTKCHKTYTRNISSLQKERSQLVNKLDACCISLTELQNKYDVDVQTLNDEISKLTQSLHKVTDLYELSQKQVHEQILAADQLLTLSNYNMARFESLTNRYDCSPNVPIICQNSPTVLPVKADTCPGQCSIDVRVPSSDNMNPSTKPIKQTVIISDSLGRGLGSMMSYYLKHSVINRCSPGATFYHLINNLNEKSLDSNTNVILLFGDSLQVKKQQIVKCIQKLLILHEKTKCKFVLCAFPYSGTFNKQQNENIHTLNLKMYNLTKYYSEAISYFDINSFTNKFRLTGDSMHLPKRCKMHIASLLAYNLNDSVTSVVTKSLDSFTNRTSSTNIFCIDSSTSSTNISIIDSSNGLCTIRNPIACLN